VDGTNTGQEIWENGCSRPPPPAGRIDVFVTCVDVHADGSFDAEFGYNSSEAVTVPAADSTLAPPQAVQPPTMFGPDEHLSVFRVSGIPPGTTVTWSVMVPGGATSVTTAGADFGTSCTEPPDPQPDLPIGVFVRCVVNHGRTYTAVFGYNNPNPDPKTIDVGTENFLSPGNADRGQPTVFATGVHARAFIVRRIPNSVDLTWTVTLTDEVAAIASAAFEPKCRSAPPPPPGPPGPPAPVPPLPIGVFASCVINHGSTFDAMFGYVNENAEQVNIPIGPDNSVSRGTPNGQPEMFSPGFVDRVFTVIGVRASRAVRWTIRLGDETRVATVRAGFRKSA
jgi:hypothetical protein